MSDLDIFKKQLSMLHLEEVLSELPQVEAPLRHTFGGGVYVRELFIPKGSIIIGKRHRGETMNMMTQGVLALYMGSDEPAQIVKAPQTFVSPPFTKKMAIALEDTIFVNIHPTSETNLTKIEEEFIIKEEDYQKLVESGELDGLIEIPKPDEEGDSGRKGWVLE